MGPVFQSLRALNRQHSNRKDPDSWGRPQSPEQTGTWKDSTATHVSTTPCAHFPNSFYPRGRGPRWVINTKSKAAAQPLHTKYGFDRRGLEVPEVMDSSTGHQDQSRRPADRAGSYTPGSTPVSWEPARPSHPWALVVQAEAKGTDRHHQHLRDLWLYKQLKAVPSAFNKLLESQRGGTDTLSWCRSCGSWSVADRTLLNSIQGQIIELQQVSASNTHTIQST